MLVVARPFASSRVEGPFLPALAAFREERYGGWLASDRLDKHMQYTYLNWSLILLFLWVLVFACIGDSKRKMVIVSLGTMPFGLTQPIFYPEYWFPPTLFDMAIRTGFDLESLIFSFAVGGLASSFYEIWHKSNLEHAPPCFKNNRHHRFHSLALASPLLVFPPLFVFTTLNPIYSASIAMLVGGVAAGLCRPDLWSRIIYSAIVFLGFYFVFFATMSWVHPLYVAMFWNMAEITGFLVLGVPIEELMFGVTFGMMWGGLYEHLGWYRIQKNGV